ncbi:MAG: hypothetical protein AMXMBFR82_26640 [Candidatus Hydrogenedentota bacterium]
MFRFGSQTDEVLVLGTLSGRRDDFGVLVRRYFPMVRAVALARLGNADDADDAAQESFVRAFERLDTLREPAKFGAWVIAIARDRAYKMLRKRLREQHALETVTGEEVAMAPEVERREIDEAVHRHIARLEDNQREVIVLYYVCGKSVREIATLLDATPNAIKKRLQRARETLRRTALRDLAKSGLDPNESEKRASQVMGIIGTMGVAWEASAGAGAGVAVAAGGLLSAKVVFCLAAGICVVAAMLSLPFVDRMTVRSPGESVDVPNRFEGANAGDEALNDFSGANRQSTHTEARANGSTPVSFAISAEGSVSGRVIEESGDGVANAVVVILDHRDEVAGRAETGSDGRFQVAKLPGGTYTAIAEGDFVVPQDRSATFSISDDAPHAEITIPIELGGMVTGRVSDADSGQGVGGITVYASASGNGAASNSTTDNDGLYRLTGVRGGRTRVVCGGGFPGASTGESDAFQYVLVKPGQTIDEVNFALEEGLTVSGVVVDDRGAPVAEAEVAARGTDTGGARTAISDLDGAFVLRGLNATPELYVMARKTGWAAAPAGPVPLDSAGIRNLAVTLVPESLVMGQVVDQLGKPVPDATITAYPEDPFVFREPRTISSANGEFTLTGLWAGNYDIGLAPPTASQSEGAVKRVTVPKSDTLGGLILVCLTGDLTISGTVTDGGKNPLNGITVSAVGSFEGQTFTRRATTNADGKYVIEGLPGGTCEVHIFDTRYMEARQWDVATGAEHVDFELGPRARINGQVLRADTGEPLTRFEVLVHPGLAMKVSPWMEHEFVQMQDDEGRFTLDNVPGSMGFVFVAARAPGYAASVRELPGIAAGHVVDGVVLRLAPAVAVRGVVVNEAGQPIAGALIFAGGMPEDSTPETGASTRTGADGAFSLEGVGPDVEQVTAYHAHYAPGSSSLPVHDATLRIVLASPAAVRGVVTLDGIPLAEEWVRLEYRQAGPIASEEAATDAAGAFGFAGLPPGDVQISVSHWSELESGNLQYELTRQARIVSGSESTVDLALQSGASGIGGSVLIGGVPARSGEVEITVHTAHGDFSRTASIDAGGWYSLSNIPAGPAELFVKAQSNGESPIRVRAAEVELVAGETLEQNVEFGPGGSLHVRVIGEDAGIGIVPGEAALPNDPGLQGFAAIERALVWDGECAAGESIHIDDLEPGRYTAIAVVDPLGERRVDSAFITIDENAMSQVVLSPR